MQADIQIGGSFHRPLICLLLILFDFGSLLFATEQTTNLAPARKWEPRALDMRFRQLMLDDMVVISAQGAKKIYPQAVPSNHVCLKAEEPWEKTWGAGVVNMPCVMYDAEAGLYRMWYFTCSHSEGYHYPVLYAESKDGLTWTKPQLGLHEFQGDGCKNNILDLDYLLTTVVSLPPGSPAKYRTFREDKYQTGLADDGRAIREIQNLNMPTTPNSIETRQATGRFNSDTARFAYDPVDKLFRAHIRTSSPLSGSAVPNVWRRAVAPAVSQDGITWTFSGRVLQADLLDDLYVANLPYRQQKDKPAWAELHDMSLFRYEGLLIGLADLMMFYDRGVDSFPIRTSFFPASGLNTIEFLSWSRDGNNWSRPVERRPFLAVDSSPGTSHYGFQLFAQTPPLCMGNELWLYYGVPEGATNDTGRPLKPEWISFAYLRVDGWAGYEAETDNATIETERFLADGEELKINANCAAGSMRLEMLEEVGEPVGAKDRTFRTANGFSRDECLPIVGDVFDHQVHWKKQTWKSLKGKTVRLRFYLPKSATLYSFWTKDRSKKER